MTWVGVLLIGIGLADLLYSVRPLPWAAGIIASIGAVTAGILGGLDGQADAVALLVIAAVVLAWRGVVGLGSGPDRAWVPLLYLGTAVGVAVLCSPLAGPGGGPVDRWLAATPWPVAAGLDAASSLLLLGGVLVQLSTGNVVVRLVLRATGTVNPAQDPSRTLKGGRLLGPMERVFILCLGLAGQVTAASIVIAAKGLLRFPELQAKRGGPEIDEITEYFLVGSFVSWLVALVTLVLVAT